MAPPFLKTHYRQDIRLFSRGGGAAFSTGLAVYILLIFCIQQLAPQSFGPQEWLVLAAAYGVLLGAIVFRYGNGVLFYSILLVMALTVPQAGTVNMISQLSYFYIFSLAALSMFILTGLSGQVSLGHGAFMACGAYVTALLQGGGYDLVISLVASIAVAAFAGFIFGLLAGRLSPLFTVFATFAIAFIVLELLNEWQGAGGFSEAQWTRATAFAGFSFEGDTFIYYLAFGVLCAGLLMVLNVQRSLSGRALSAVKESEELATSVGVNSVYYRALAFAFSAGVIGAAGSLYAIWARVLEPESFGMILSVSLLAMVFIGGVGRVQGALFGAAFLVFLPEMLTALARLSLGASRTAFVSEPLAHGFEKTADILSMPLAQTAALGLAMFLASRFAPGGIDGALRRIGNYLRFFPFSRSAKGALVLPVIKDGY